MSRLSSTVVAVPRAATRPSSTQGRPPASRAARSAAASNTPAAPTSPASTVAPTRNARTGPTRSSSSRAHPCGEHGVRDDLSGRTAVGRHRDHGDLAVERQPLLEQGAQLGPGVEREHRPGAVEADPVAAADSPTSSSTTWCPRSSARVSGASTAPPPSASTPSCSASAVATAARSSARKRLLAVGVEDVGDLLAGGLPRRRRRCRGRRRRAARRAAGRRSSCPRRGARRGRSAARHRSSTAGRSRIARFLR